MTKVTSGNIVTVLCEGSMKAMGLHLIDNKYQGLNNHANINAISAKCLKQVLFEDLKRFLDNDLKEASESNLGEAWLRKIVNVQCNAWALQALSLVAEKTNIN